MAHGLSRCSTFKYGSAGTSAKTVIPLDGTVGRWWRRRRRRRSIDPPIIFQVRITHKTPGVPTPGVSAVLLCVLDGQVSISLPGCAHGNGM